ncbi:MAG: STAS domain-containing protein [Candidatus Polarisedimenticolaceae bacterium]|nr:STAS domain-containing protein [Candidatus Polarisedimenticolaceae bacterium]
MAITRQDNGGKKSKKCRLTIDGEMTIYMAEALKADLDKYLGNSWDLEIDLSAVTELDTAGAQLLLLAARETERAERQFSIIPPTGEAFETIKMLNLQQRLNLPEAAS